MGLTGEITVVVLLRLVVPVVRGRYDHARPRCPARHDVSTAMGV